MKNLFRTLIVLTLIALMAVATACEGNPIPLPPGIGNGGGGDFTSVAQSVESMPSTTDGNAIENSVRGVFGLNLNLPNGTYQTQSYSTESIANYIVIISGANQSESEYYNSLYAEMVSKGYTPVEEEYYYVKIVGTVVYGVGVYEEMDGTLEVYFSVTDTAEINGGTTPGGTTPGGTIPGGTIPGGTTTQLPEGNLTQFPVDLLNETFSFLGITIPNCTSGSSYSVDAITDETQNGTKTGTLSVVVTCYGTTDEEASAYSSALQNAGFMAYGILIFNPTEPNWESFICQRSTNRANQTHKLTFSVSYNAPPYVLPSNLKIEYTDGYTSYIGIKIANDYYVKNFQGNSVWSEKYYKKTDEGWDCYEKDFNGWSKSNYDGYDNDEEEDLHYAVFNFVTSEAKYVAGTQLTDATIAGKSCSVWKETYESYNESYTLYQEKTTGLVFKYEEAYGSSVETKEVTSYSTAITGFDGIELPNFN